ncbi:MAG TPA: RusA family crossover junction endodeoxyribonuclease, partial [Actinomycetota bacterium]|nr:RusA family crossover junction endodeoxyribonuclease [Actinomycetota bacterium]
GAPLRQWRADVVEAARRELDGMGPLDGPLHVEATFYLRRPKRGAPIYPVRRPDLDKLTRGLLDALTAASVFGDDAQVVDLVARKRYAAEPRVEVAVYRLPDASMQPRELARRLLEALETWRGVIESRDPPTRRADPGGPASTERG